MVRSVYGWMFVVGLFGVGGLEGKVDIRSPWEEVVIKVKLEPQSHRIEGVGYLTFPDKGPSRVGFLLNSRLQVTKVLWGEEALSGEVISSFAPEEVSTAYGVYGEWESEGVNFYRYPLPKRASRGGRLRCEVHWEGEIYEPPVERGFSREEIALEARGTIESRGIFLSPSAWWYPRLPDAPIPHTLTCEIPAGWQAITDGAVVDSQTVGERFIITYRSLHPTPALTLSAGPYQIFSDTLGEIPLYCYFFPPQAALAPRYLSAVKRYIRLYGDLISPYPFPRFSVVDNFLPSGYGLPGWTLIGSEVLHLPFITETSLGHEVLHNWFGNRLGVDYREGNWCEGLTTYLADYFYQTLKDSLSATDYRMNILKDYAAYVHSGNEYPVAKFSERRDPRDRAIGYGKVMMIFHMLKNLLDQRDSTLFSRLLRETFERYQGQSIGWSVWQKEAQRLYKERLDWFFDQWVKWQGAPRLAWGKIVADQGERGWRVKAEIVAEPYKPRPYWLLIPIRAITAEGNIDYLVFQTQSPQNLELEGVGHLHALRLDPDYHLFRVLYPSEAPVTLSSFFGDPHGVFILPANSSRSDSYRRCAEGLKKEGQEIGELAVGSPENLSDFDYNERSLWIIGSPQENRLWELYPPPQDQFRYLPARAPRWREDEPLPEGFWFRGEEFRGGEYTLTFVTWHPQAVGERVIVYTFALPDADPLAGMRKLPHYGRYSYLLFHGETNVQKGVWGASGDHPLLWRVNSRY